MDLNWLSIAEANKGLKEKKFSAEELTRSCLDQIKATEKLNTVITLTEDHALKGARAADAAGFDHVLSGIPCGIKDIFNVKGFKATNGSRMLETYVSPYESTATGRLWRDGAVMLGKMNMDDSACGTTNESSYFGPVQNPWNAEYVPGGSSGGSAAAVAAGQMPFALGTDTGGSIRLPSSLCGVVGLKVTYGRVSRYGVIAMASSWDTIGPITRTVEDAAIVLQSMAGHDRFDATTPDIVVPDYSANLGKDLAGLKIGIPKEYFGEGVDEEIRDIVMEAVKEYEKMGAVIKEVSLPMTKYGVAVYYVTMPAEFSTNMSRYDGVRFGHKPEAETDNLLDYYKHSRGEGFGDEIKRRIMIGTFSLSAGYADAYYKQAQRARTLICRDFDEAYKEVDVLLAPVAATQTFKLGEKTNDPLALYLADALTIPACAAGLPSVSLPCGFAKNGMPVGMQIMGPQFREDLILQVAGAYEQVTDWHKQRPSI